MRRFLVGAISSSLLSAALLLSGCGSGNPGGITGTPTIALTITQQPADETVPLGGTGSFSVSATGDGSLTYQWSRNGTPISGGTSASLTTDAVAMVNSGDNYSVTVRDSKSTAISNSAKLTVGARSPKAGDLRFQQVGSAATAASANIPGRTGNTGIYSSIISNAFLQYVGSPLELGPAYINCVQSAGVDCSWGFYVLPLPASTQVLGIVYTAGNFQTLNADLQALPSRNNLTNLPVTNYVVTSLALPVGVNAYAVAATYGTLSSGFDLKQESVSAADLQATIVADGLQSRVVTALGFDASGNVRMFSYGWQGDTTTAYDVSSTIVAAGDVAATAQKLAAQGYILTAFGGDEVHGYTLIGTKVQGDTLARPLIAATLAQGKQTTTTPSTSGYAPVGFVNYAGPADVSGAASYATILYEQ